MRLDLPAQKSLDASFSALAKMQRRELLEVLARTPGLSLSDLGGADDGATRRLLDDLRRAGLVSVERRSGRLEDYSLCRTGLQLAYSWFDDICEDCDQERPALPLDPLFFALRTRRRREIAKVLATGGELTIQSLALRVQTTQPIISRQVATLLTSGLIHTRREAPYVHVRLDPVALYRAWDWLYELMKAKLTR